MLTQATTRLTMRRYAGEADYWRIRQFLRAVFQPTQTWELNWLVSRWDYNRWHIIENIQHYTLEEVIFLWETGDGQIAAVAHPEDKGDIYFQVDPTLRTRELEEEMFAVAEQHLAVATDEGGRELRVWANEHDSLREDLLVRRGYHRGEWPEYQRRRSLALPIPEAPIAEGYTVRPLGGEDEWPRRSWVSWRAFHPDAPDAEYQGWAWYGNIQRAPTYRRDLDLVAVAPGGEFAGFCTVWFDDVTRWGLFEPVGTAPEHQRRGLGKAMMCEGLRRLRRLGATTATVGSYSPRAHALYAAVGFTDYTLAAPWSKQV